MMKVHTVKAFDDNYIWLLGSENSTLVAAVDPGDADPVLAYLHDHGLALCAILITHHHYDHTGGIAELTAKFEVPVYGPANENIHGRNQAVAEGDEISLENGLQFDVLDTPGHTRGHVCYVGHSALFCGDTLFSAGCGRLFEGTAEQMLDSLGKLAALPDETQVYCAHEYTRANLKFALVAEPGNADMLKRQHEVETLLKAGKPTVPSTMGVEKKTNPFLRSHVASLVTAAEHFAGHSLNTGAEVFATVRYWKDTLD